MVLSLDECFFEKKQRLELCAAKSMFVVVLPKEELTVLLRFILLCIDSTQYSSQIVYCLGYPLSSILFDSDKDVDLFLCHKTQTAVCDEKNNSTLTEYH